MIALIMFGIVAALAWAFMCSYFASSIDKEDEEFFEDNH